MTMRVALFTPHFAPGFRAGGALRSAVNLLRTADAETEILVITSDRDLGDDSPYPGLSGRMVEFEGHRVRYVDVSDRSDLMAAYASVRHFRPDVVYVAGVWSRPFSVFPALATAARVFRPRVFLIAPRGELAQSARSVHSALKVVGAQVWRQLRRVLPLWWHATDAAEARQVTALDPHPRKVLTSLNPVDLSTTALPTSAPPAPPLRVAVAARVAPVKNLHTLVQGLQSVTGDMAVGVYGTIDDPEYHRELETLAADLPAGRLTFHGAVDHAELLDALNRSHVMAFPTLGENFGHVVAESLSQSCPVLCGDVTPHTPTLRAGGGQVVDHLDPGAWAAILDEWATASPAELRARSGAAGVAYENWLGTRETTHILSLVREELAD